MKSAHLRTAFSAVVLLIVAINVPSAFATEQLPFPLPKSPTELSEKAFIETSQGEFEIRFYRNEAPLSVRNFEYLTQKNFYSKLTFHRYVPNFIVQGGDPKGNGKGGPGYTLPPETSELRHHRGSVGMARLGNEVNPERRSNGSQFYVCLGDAPHLDGFYTIFAEVTGGMEVIDKLRVGDQIIRIRLSKDH